MGALLSAFATFLVGVLGDVVVYAGRYLIARVILSFGLSIFVITGITAGINGLESLIESQINLGSNWITSVLGLMGFDYFVNIVFTAYLAKLLLKGLTAGGSISSLVVKGQS